MQAQKHVHLMINSHRLSSYYGYDDYRYGDDKPRSVGYLDDHVQSDLCGSVVLSPVRALRHARTSLLVTKEILPAFKWSIRDCVYN